MKILIVGGSGFIGQNLNHYFAKKKIEVDILSRSTSTKAPSNNSTKFITELKGDASNYEIIINLAGEPLDKNRWNFKVKRDIYDSRIQTTKKLIDFISSSSFKPKLLINGSAVGFYGNHPTQIFNEDSSEATDNYTHRLCSDWENIARQAIDYDVRVCLIRTGIVLGPDGGALKKMLTPFELGLGSYLGNGKQWMSWIHIDDVVGAIDFLINNDNLSGPFNLTSPLATTNEIFSKELAKTLNRPCFLNLPNFAVKMIFGEMGETLLLQGQHVFPDKLLKAGYKFKFPNLKYALQNILKMKSSEK